MASNTAPNGSSRQSFWPGSLGRRILLWMSATAVLPLLAVSYQGYHCARQAVVELQENHIRSLLEMKKARLAAWFAEIRSDLQLIASDGCIRDRLESPADAPLCQVFQGRCARRLDLSSKNGWYRAISLFDSEWRLVGSSSRSPGGPAAEASTPMKEALASSDYAIIPSSGAVDSEAGAAILDRDGTRRIGYVLSRIRLQEAVSPILDDPAGMGKTGKVYILDAEGRKVAGRRQAGEARVPPPAPDATVAEYSDGRGVPVIGACTGLTVTKWLIVAEIDRSEAYKWVGTLQSRATVMAGFTLLLALSLAFYCARLLSRPFRELASFARVVTSGHVKERLGHMHDSEANEVAGAFNRMLDELESVQARLIRSASLAAVGQLSSSIVHEIRNPLSTIKMNLQAVQRKLAGDAPHAELADLALRQVGRLERMLSDLLGYARPQEISVQAVNFSDLARHVTDQVLPVASGKGVSLRTLDDIGDRAFMADPELMQRLMSNLVLNAVQAVPEGGSVEIQGRGPNGDGVVVLTVRDNGPGLSDSIQDKIFQPFFTTRSDGTGLGLANVKKIADLHGAKVYAAANPGGGAVFSVELPIIPGQVSPTSH